MKILVTGGAGYIGSHMVKRLGERGHEIVVYDNLSSGYRDAVLYGSLVIGDLSDYGKLCRLFGKEGFDAVIHFAASISVEESVRKPLMYYRNNAANIFHLLEACLRYRVNNFIFSSTAAVYGNPSETPLTEKVSIQPVNPYGFSKMMAEQALQDTSRSSELRYVSLRYFNAAGADPEGELGERHDPETHLIPLAIRAALGSREGVTMFGTDYDTPDGTCIRDYIHVRDLIDAHLLALDYLMSGGSSRVFNCGYGRGYSVREIVEAVRRVTGAEFKVIETGRREGDPPYLIADSSRIRAELGWVPACDDIDYIIKTAWEWEKKLSSVQPQKHHL
ncbi:MAG: UDP-glucose 4-epimerase GalE [Nitrospirae bacterium]|nr:UDP-glucose 4-epimerase GalE [Nitrospirota bacterium]